MTKLTKEELRETLEQRFIALVFDEWDYEDFIKDGLGSYVAATEQLLRDVVESIVPETQEAKNRYGDHLLVEGHNTCIDTIHKNLEELLS